jgi:glutathione S-transferase
MLFDSASTGDSTQLIKVASKLRGELAHFEARLTAHDHLAGAALSAADLAAYTGVTLALRAAGKTSPKTSTCSSSRSRRTIRGWRRGRNG